MAVNILTTCKITPRKGRAIHLKSIDTGREDRFASLDGLMQAKKYRHALAAYLVRFFQPKQGFLLGVTFRVAGGRRHIGIFRHDDLAPARRWRGSWAATSTSNRFA